MKKSKLHLHPLAAAIALMSGTVALPQIAFAADEARDEEEVLVVSARRRDETLQEVPISLSSFSGDALAKAGMSDLVAIGSSAPNTTLKVSRGTNTTLTAFIRGVGQQDPVAGFEAGVGLYLDDVYLNRPQGAVLDVYDVERIEILRGPQGTLYGRNTIGGAIKYVTKRLSDEPELSIKGSLGTYGQADLIVSGSLPVAGDTIKIGGSLASINRSGFGDNITTGEDHYDKDIFAARASIEFTPSDSLFIRANVDYTDDKSAPKAGFRNAPAIAEFEDDGVTPLPILNDVYDTRAGIGTDGTHPINENFQDAFGTALQIEWSFTDDLTFKSTTAYREDEQESLIDFDGLPGNSFDVYVAYENDQLSQEFQLVYEGERVQGIAGFYYLDANAFNAFDVVLGTIAGGSASFTIGDVNTKTWAVFADANINLTDTVDLSVGARFTDDKRTANVIKNFNVGTLVSPYFTDNSADLSGNSTNFNGERTDSEFTPRISVSWQPDDELHIYLGYSMGFKGGGFDPRGAYTTVAQGEGFSPETVSAYEFGVKSKHLDGLVTSNFALFYSDYTDVQIPGSIAVDTTGDGINNDFAGSTSNAGEARIRGLEYELTANLTDNFKVDLSVGLIDAEFLEFEALTDVMATAEDVDVNGDGTLIVDVTYDTGADLPTNEADNRVFQNTPDATFGLNLTYDIAVGPGELSLLAGANYTSQVHQDVVVIPNLVQDGYTLFNASVTWISDDDHWNAGLHAQNLSDKEYVVAGYNFNLAENSRSQFHGNPRTITATLKYNF